MASSIPASHRDIRAPSTEGPEVRAGALWGSAALVNWLEPEVDCEPEFNQWHTLEHLPERMSLPGFLRVRRFIAESAYEVRDRPVVGRYLTVYEGRKLQTFRSAPYLARLNAPTEWTRSMASKIRSNRRVVARVITSIGTASSGRVLVAESGQGSAEPDAVHAVYPHPRVVAVHLLEVEPIAAAARSGTTEGDLARHIPQPPQPSRLVILELGYDADVVELADRLGSAGMTQSRTYSLSVEIAATRT